ncbi:hypothetical protein MKX01_014612 [Papaver californicum]|nr:hypothetical protein MKX01_014612 [Papaver californicum]
MDYLCYSDPPCDGKLRWPELMGATIAQAKAKIFKDHPDPDLRFFIILPNMVPRSDYCCNRVNLFVNNSGIVIRVPIIG